MPCLQPSMLSPHNCPVAGHNGWAVAAAAGAVQEHDQTSEQSCPWPMCNLDLRLCGDHMISEAAPIKEIICGFDTRPIAPELQTPSSLGLLSGLRSPPTGGPSCAEEGPGRGARGRRGAQRSQLHGDAGERLGDRPRGPVRSGGVRRPWWGCRWDCWVTGVISSIRSKLVEKTGYDTGRGPGSN